MNKNETLKIQVGTDNIVEFLYDTPKTGVNSFGNWYLYGIKKKSDGGEAGIFATEKLHEKLQFYKKGDTVNIRKEEYSAGKFGWNVIPEEGTNSKSVIDARTQDIHKQVCLKLAVSMMDKKNAIFSEGDLVVIEANTKGLLRVLEGKESEDVSDEVLNPPI